MVKEEGLHQPKAQGQRQAAARNEKAVYNKAHGNEKKEGAST